MEARMACFGQRSAFGILALLLSNSVILDK